MIIRMAKLIDQAGMDVILWETPLQRNGWKRDHFADYVDQMIYHGKSVMKAVNRALVVVDLPRYVPRKL
ncbi:MAG: 3-methyl-2-oxobutanoate hydroxymethyltransferase [Parabacteroides distasonis]